MFGCTRNLVFKFLFEPFCNFPSTAENKWEFMRSRRKFFIIHSVEVSAHFGVRTFRWEHSTVFRNWWKFSSILMFVTSSDDWKTFPLMYINYYRLCSKLRHLLADVRKYPLMWVRMWMLHQNMDTFAHSRLRKDIHRLIITIHYDEMLSEDFQQKQWENFVDLRFTGARRTFARKHIQSSSHMYILCQ